MGGTVSVVVVVTLHAQARDLHRLLHHLARQDYLGPVDVVVIDVGHRPRLHREHYLGYRMPVTVLHETQPGLAQARNRAISAATGQWVLIAEPEALPCQEWISTMVSALANSGAPLVGGQILPEHSRAVDPRLGPGVLSLFMPTVWPSTITELRPPWLLSDGNLGMPRSAALRFEPALSHRRFLLCEELLLMLRGQAAGEYALLEPRALVRRVLHERDLTAGSIARRAWRQGAALARVAHSMPMADVPQYPRRETVRNEPFSRAWLLSTVASAARAAGRHACRPRHKDSPTGVTTCV
ncbi:glycosyltransferase family A protein [Streptomyces abikoensis]|uniref:Glycosyltransferase family A protein n=1 Tax=Streptomyces abikoensis TaxID=97398 RepID=A0ABW7T4M3_9ACTN